MPLICVAFGLMGKISHSNQASCKFLITIFPTLWACVDAPRMATDDGENKVSNDIKEGLKNR